MSRENEMRAVLITVRDNLRSLMAAYPDKYPRHAFQGTLDLVCETVGTSDELPTFSH